MTYKKWFETQGKLHKKVMEKLEGKSIDEVIKYFSFDSMVKNEPDFCPLYKEGKKCHEMEDLNCYLCACPSFRFEDEGFKKLEEKTLYSFCAINSKKGKSFISEDSIHQDCSACTVPHKKNYIKKHFSKDWFEVMKEVKKI